MLLYKNDVKITMTGLDRAMELSEEIHKKSAELRDLVEEFRMLSLEMGIDIVRTPVEGVDDVKEADQIQL